MNVEPVGLPPVIAVVIHDVAPPTWAECLRLVAHLDAIDPRLCKTWLVVPRYHDHSPGPRMLEALARMPARGDELALHGWRHLDDGTPASAFDRWKRTHYTAGEGEFAGLDATQAAQRIAAGRAWFARQGWPLHGFVPPAWLANAASLGQIERAGFDYTCSLGGFKVWTSGAGHEGVAREALDVASQSVVYSTRSWWRRAMSLAWNAGVARHQADRWLLRIELHPCDVRHAGVRRSFTRIVERALDAGREPVTLGEAASRLRAWQAEPRRALQPIQPSSPPIRTAAAPVNAPVSAPASTSPG